MSFEMKIEMDGQEKLIKFNDLKDNFPLKLKQAILKGHLKFEFEVQQNLRSGKFGIKNRSNSAGLMGSMTSKVQVSGGQYVGTTTFNKVYASIQEDGGRINITTKMSKFAWHMFFDTGEPMWKAIALKKGGHITIPPHHYASGTLKASKPDIIAVITRSLLN